MKKNLFLLILLLLWGCTKEPSKTVTDYSFYLDQKVIAGLDFKNKALIPVKIKNHWYYVRYDGKAMRVILDEKGRVDIFREGLARTRINGKIGFFDQSLDMVLTPQYDYAFPFHNGVAEICIGCQEIQEVLDGGTWKRIDRTGLVLEEE